MEVTDATVDIRATDTAWRIVIDDELPAEVARTSSIPVARFKVPKPELPRPGRPRIRVPTVTSS